MAIFETSVTLCSPLESIFDFFIRPENIQQISPPEMGLNFIDPPDILEAGCRLEFKLQGFGQVQHIVHEVSDLECPHGYTETQVQGPLKQWLHEHRFESDTAEQTIVTDRIEFQLPGGLMGLLLTEARVRESLEDGFYHRHEQLKQIFHSPNE